MADYTYDNIKTDLTPMLHNKLGSVANLRNVINRAVRKCHTKRDFRSTRRNLGIPVGFYNSIYEVPAPSDLKDTAIIDLGSIRERSDDEEWVHVTNEEFDRTKQNSSDDFIFAVDESSRLKKLKVNGFGNSTKVQLSACDVITGDNEGTWSVGGSGSNLAQDKWNYLTGTASLSFDTSAGATSSTLTNSSFTDVDLTNYKNKSNIFVSLYVPSADAATYLSSVTLDWGNDSSNYYSKSVSVNHSNLAFQKGWNILSFDWLSSTENGSVTDTAIDYLKLTIATSASIAAASDWRVDNIVVIKGDLHDIYYYSNMYWKSAAGTYLQNSTADTDVLIADEDEYDIFLTRCAIECAQGLREVQADLPFFLAENQEAIKMYRYKSERKPIISEYHKFRKI